VRTVRGATRGEIQEIADRIGYDPSWNCKGIVFDDLRAGCLYDHWTPNSANVHIYSRSARDLLSYLFVREIFSYPFEKAGLNLLLAITPSDNEASLAFSKALGFREVYRVRDGWRVGVDLVMKEMTKAECQWLQKRAA
jgi:L-amino acid N-acyltransferase YncA